MFANHSLSLFAVILIKQNQTGICFKEEAMYDQKCESKPPKSSLMEKHMSDGK